MQGKTIWITGASSGIGEALAQELSARGARLVLSARREDRLEEVRARCHGAERHIIQRLDLAESETHADAVAQVISEVGGIDIMVHNGGISQRSLVQDTDLSVDRRIMEVNFFGTVSLTKALLPAMLEKEAGHFVVISSLVGKFGTPLRSAYAASKHALHGFFESLQAEAWEQGIRVTMVCPGFIRTEISTKALKGDGSAHATMDEALAKGMPRDVCARKIANAIRAQKAELIVGGRETAGVWVKRFFPALFRNAIRKVKVK